MPCVQCPPSLALLQLFMDYGLTYDRSSYQRAVGGQTGQQEAGPDAGEGAAQQPRRQQQRGQSG